MNEDSIEIYIEKHGDKIRKVLVEKFDFSNRLMNKLEEEENIYLNDKKASLDKNTYIDDVLRVDFRDEDNIYKECKMNLKILYEDEDILGIDKPPFMLVHPSKDDRIDTLANGVVWYFKEKGLKRKIRFINRLDMNTSGVVLIAKNSFGHSRLMKEMNNNIVVKKYLAFVEGTFNKKEDTIDLPIGLLEGENIKRAVIKSGDYSISKYRVVEEYNNITLVEIEIETGRTHQIRVHMSHIGHPVIGDELYGRKSKLINRQALHCSEMNFKGTRRKEIITVKALIPEDFKKIMEESR